MTLAEQIAELFIEPPQKERTIRIDGVQFAGYISAFKGGTNGVEISIVVCGPRQREPPRPAKRR